MKFPNLNSDDGNVLIEAVGFTLVSAGLLLVGGLQIFEAQQTVMELSSLARNTMRSVAIDPDLDWNAALEFQQRQLPFFADKEVDFQVRCLDRCLAATKVLELKLMLDGYTADAYGAIGE